MQISHTTTHRSIWGDENLTVKWTTKPHADGGTIVTLDSYQGSADKAAVHAAVTAGTISAPIEFLTPLGQTWVKVHIIRADGTYGGIYTADQGQEAEAISGAGHNLAILTARSHSIAAERQH